MIIARFIGTRAEWTTRRQALFGERYHTNNDGEGVWLNDDVQPSNNRMEETPKNFRVRTKDKQAALDRIAVYMREYHPQDIQDGEKVVLLEDVWPEDPAQA